MMIGMGIPISHNKAPRMVRDSVYGGDIPYNVRLCVGVPGGNLRGDDGAGRGLELERRS